MSNKLNQGELLEYLEIWKDAFKTAVKKSWLISMMKKDIKKIELKRIEQAYQQIKEMIKKPEVTEEWIEGWATWLIEEGCIQHLKPSFIKDFIRSLVESLTKGE